MLLFLIIYLIFSKIEPAQDPNTNTDEEYSIKNSLQLDANQTRLIKPLQYLFISNLSNKFEQVHLNIGQFKKDLCHLTANTRLNRLELTDLNELDDSYFQCLFTTPSLYPFTNYVHIFDSIETISFNKMNGISGNLVFNYLVKAQNTGLKTLNLNDCKLITR